jgi:hypothetical protein
MEKKYRWRGNAVNCPKCGNPSIFKSKDKPEFYCWKKKDGCGSTFPLNTPAITSQGDGSPTENPDLYDMHNTVLKMAKKRAHVDAAITLGCLSEMFTQDIEDTFRPDAVMGAARPYEGEIIDAEIVPEATPPPVKSAPGLFTNDHQQAVKRFLEWLGNKCDATNKAWHEAWSGVRDATSDEALQFWPTKIPDAINKFGAKGHLWKWAVRSNLVEGVTEHEGAKPAQVDAFLAKVWIENREAITDEMRRYVGEKKGELEAKIYRDNPDIAPEGYFAEDEPRTESQTPLVPDDEDDDAFEEGRE